MAIVSSTAIGKAKGSIGNVVFSTQKGRTIARERNYSPANPNTEAQQVQRTKMADVVAAFKLIGKPASAGFTVGSKVSSTYNRFVTANIAGISEVLTDSVYGALVPYRGLVVANGSLVKPYYYGQIEGKYLAVYLSLGNMPETDVKAGDKVVLVGYNPTSKEVIVKEEVLTADDVAGGSPDYTLTFKTTPDRSLCSCAAFILSADGTKSSYATMELANVPVKA